MGQQKQKYAQTSAELQSTENQRKEKHHQAKKLPSLKILNECFDLDKDLGVLTWKVRPLEHFNTARGCKRSNSQYSGKEAGCYSIGKDKKPCYKKVKVMDSKFGVHRVIWKMINEKEPVGDIDHIDGNGLNNKPENLRLVSVSANCKNRKIRKNNTSGVTGVSKRAGDSKWTVRVSVGLKEIVIGTFNDFDMAVSARRKAELQYGYLNRN